MLGNAIVSSSSFLHIVFHASIRDIIIRARFQFRMVYLEYIFYELYTSYKCGMYVDVIELSCLPGYFDAAFRMKVNCVLLLTKTKSVVVPIWNRVPSSTSFNGCLG